MSAPAATGIPSLTECGYDQAWGPDSLARLRMRLRAPLEARFCRNPKCGAWRAWRPGFKGRKGGHGFCVACYQRWNYADRPDEVPEPFERVLPPGTWSQRNHPAAPERVLTSGSWGYRPSTGTAGMGEASRAA